VGVNTEKLLQADQCQLEISGREDKTPIAVIPQLSHKHKTEEVFAMRPGVLVTEMGRP